MLELALKEMKELKATFMAGVVLEVWIVLCAVVQLMYGSDLQAMDMLAVSTILVLWIIFTALIVVPLTEGREQGTSVFLEALPLSRLRIWLTKLSVGLGAALVIMALFGLLVALVLHVVVKLEPRVPLSTGHDWSWILYFILVTMVSALFSAALCKRALTAMIVSLISTAGLIVAYNMIRVVWFWYPQEPVVLVRTVLAGLTIIALSLFYRRARQKERVYVWTALLVLVLISVTVLVGRNEYHRSFYAPPDPNNAELMILSTDGENLLIKENGISPLYVYNIPNKHINRISGRFEGQWLRGISPSGRYIMYDNTRGLLGTSLMINSDHPVYSGSRLSLLGITFYWSMIGANNPEGYLPNLKWMVFDTQTGTKYQLSQPDSERIEVFPQQWHPFEDQIMVCAWDRASESYAAINLVRPDGSLVKTLVNDAQGYITLSDDGRSLRKMVVGTQPGPALIYRLELDDEEQVWTLKDDIKNFSYDSPNGVWSLKATRIDEPARFDLVLEKRNGTTLHMGSLARLEPYALWSPDSRYLFTFRDVSEQTEEFLFFDTESGEFNVVPEQVGSILSAGGYNFCDQGGQLKRFSPNGTWLAIGKNALNAKLVLFNAENGDFRISDQEVNALGWLKSEHFLIKKQGSLQVWDVQADHITPLIAAGRIRA
ncbi:hypothetical protein JXQ70_14720 [bacterium]|nr:hypothetical protein [bacterium]